MVEFYIVLDGSRGFPKWDFSNRNILVSAGSLWWAKRMKFVRRRIPKCRKFFLDSGGFSLLNKYGDYPFSIEDYVNLIKHYRPHYAAIMDYPCEPDINRLNLLGKDFGRIQLKEYISNKERIEQTIMHTIEILKYEKELAPTQIIPVIQGYTLQEYKYCIDRMCELGIFDRCKYVAVGSMCRRINNKELRKYIVAITDYVWTTHPDIRFHFFGLKLNALKDYVCATRIYSCDSAAWDLLPSSVDPKRKYPVGEEKYQCFLEYMKKIDNIIECHTKQKQLFNVWPVTQSYCQINKIGGGDSFGKD